MQISIKTNFPDVQRRLDELQRDVRTKATVSAVNKTIEQARTQMIREITSEYAVKAGYVRERLRIKRASLKGGEFAIEAALMGGASNNKRAANVIAFVEQKVTLAEGRRRAKAGTANQLFVKIKRNGGKKSLGPLAFIGNKGRTVFVRVGKGRLPIKPVQTIDIQQMFNQRRINASVLLAIKDRFPAIFEHEANFYVAKFSRGA